MNFSVSEKQQERLNTWLKEQEKILLKKQKATMLEEDYLHLTNNGEYPYYGAIGGGIEYIFVPTSIGTALRVKFMSSGQEINLTDYENW